MPEEDVDSRAGNLRDGLTDSCKVRQGTAHRFSAVEADDGQVAGYGQAAGARPLEDFGGGQVDITNGKFVFSASEAYMIEDGKITYPVKGATLIGNGPDVMNRISMIGNDMRLDSGVGVCGKEGQSVPVGVGQPTLRIDGVTVGGTA